MVHVIGPRDPRRPDAINTTSRSNNWSRELSPFFLGPVDLYDGYSAQNLENGWQFAKVYAQYVDQHGNPTPEYFAWAESGWGDRRAQRYPMGKNAKPLYSLWAGRKLTYVQARREIYLPLYSRAVIDTQAFQRLLEMSREQDLWLWDFDAYDHRALGMSLEDVLNCPDRKCGHGFVLAMMLEGACGFP